MDNCIFCKIAEKKIQTRLIYEDDLAVAFEDTTPQAPVHILIIPKRHISNLIEIQESDKDIIWHLIKVINKIAMSKGIAESGFRVINNCNAAGGQTVYHIHFHLIGGRQMLWPPG